LELPPLSDEFLPRREPVLRMRHSITNTNYDVQVYKSEARDSELLHAVKAETSPGLAWISAARLHTLPLTGLARKVLRSLNLMVN